MGRSLLIAICVVGVGGAALLLPVELPYSIEGLGRIMPEKEWVITRGADGRLLSTLHDNRKGLVQTYSVHHFERGDNVKFELYPSILPGVWVSVGDTVGLLFSSEAVRQLAQLEGQLATAQAELALYRAGRKESVVGEAEQRLTYAEAQVAQQRKRIDRLQALFGQGLASEEELEIEENLLRLYEIQIDIAQAKLQTAQSGSRQQRVDLAVESIASLQREIEVLSDRMQNFTILSPVTGSISSFFSADTLVAVRGTASYIVAMPVKWSDRSDIVVRQQVELAIEDGSAPVSGRIERLDNTVQVLNGEQIFLVVAALEGKGKDLTSGLIVPYAIICEKIGLLEYLHRVFLS